MPKRIQCVARIEPDLRKAVGRAMRRKKTTLNALVETALRAYLEGQVPESLIKANAPPPPRLLSAPTLSVPSLTVTPPVNVFPPPVKPAELPPAAAPVRIPATPPPLARPALPAPPE